ncbi:ATP-dependent Clp protease ATP-binding subunit ClpA [Sulfidibacter corallicola]|uniref:ATP-dependent Clp protease ATP-binding subunit ClpA n=1 Tax=Sulfidibacter corallicola TaxID=2818388 RepID=A0A8A4TNM0_SULCO|nr:ATP-dependent Clp protease ATP-binding subunit ClpA [Sulfidibacter corallicola]QTD50804.1 ATP-dependent Clp protease ATP-binding subunit ClpA [Sulfidibacter corallicola]
MISKDLEQAIHHAYNDAKRRNHEFFTLEHLLYALLQTAKAKDIVVKCGGNVEQLRSDLEDYLLNQVEQLPDSVDIDPRQTLAIQRVLQRAALHVQSSGRTEMDSGNVLVSMFREKDSYSVYLIEKQGISRFDVINYISHGISKVEGDHHYEIEEVGEAARGAEGGKNPLEAFTVDLVAQAEEGKIDPLIGREKEVRRTIQVLCRRKKNNPLYIGDPGVGKTALAEGLALMIQKAEVPEVLKDARIFALDMGALLANTKFRGEFEARLKGVVKALQEVPHAILFIDEIHTIVGAGATSGGSMDASNILKPALASGELKCIGSTTHEDYRASFEKDRALARRFQKIDINEPSAGETYQILLGLKPKYEKHHSVKYANEALKSAADLAAKHINHRHLPDKAIDVIDEVGAAQQLHPVEERKTLIETADVEEIIASMAKIPPKTVSTTEGERLSNLERDLKLVVFGQDQAILALSKAIIMSRSGLRTGDKPVGSFLFAGPTGVGKTEVAKQLAHILAVNFVRFDMSEYMEKHSVSRLIGAPPGYVGFDQAGLLTDAVNKSPYSVILLDEIEKAHPDIFNILLQVMDHASLTDHNGKKADFRNAIIIMTSNAGASDMASGSIGFGDSTSGAKSKGKQALEKLFTPEFRNRLDGTIHFNHLSKEIMEKVVDKFIDELDHQLLDKSVQLRLTPPARAHLAEKGYDKAFGARPLSRVIDQDIKQRLASELLFGALTEGGTAVIDFAEGELVFSFEKNPSNTKTIHKVEESAI